MESIKNFESMRIDENQMKNIQGGGFPCYVGDYIYRDTATIDANGMNIWFHPNGFPEYEAGETDGYWPPQYIGNIC